jgi:streptogramin lyase
VFVGPVGTLGNDEQDRVTVPQTTTIAGSGTRGLADGAVASATFLTPCGVAVAANGTIYVADVAAQNIRRIQGGVVDTFAGASLSEPSPEGRVGGYTDGPVASARFNRPIAIATHGNDVYVADAGNEAVRKISGGVVTTIAKRIGNLKGIAVAENGDVYVADDGTGLRRLNRDGSATVLSVPSEKKSVSNVTLREIDGHEYLAYIDSAHIYLEALGALKPQQIAYDDEREPDSASLPVGRANAIAILNENTVVITDATTHAVRFVRFPAPPYVTGRVVRAIAGGISEGNDVAGGFADGPPWRARLDTPTAIAVASDGSLIVADAGNRRIRRISGVDPRESVLPDLSNFAISDRDYNIAIVGNSYAFYNVLWPESIGGRIEAGLARDQARIGLPTKPNVTVFRIDAASDDAAISVIHEYLYDKRTSLVILMLNAYVAMRSSTLQRLQGQLDDAGVKLLVVFTPQGYQVSPRDFWQTKHETGAFDFRALHLQAVESQSYYAMTGVHGLYLLSNMEAQEGLRNRPPLFYSSEHHLTVYGSEWVGRRITDELERWKPWQRNAT